MKNQNTRNFIIVARKSNKILEFYTIFAPKMPEFYRLIVRKIFSEFGGGAGAPPAQRLLRL